MSRHLPARAGTWLRICVSALLAVAFVGGVYMLWPAREGHKLVAYFTSAVGLYSGDDVRVAGVPVGRVESIEPQSESVKITMSVRSDVRVPVDARAIIMAPNLVDARFIQLTPAYTGGPAMPDGARIALGHTGVPVEWDEVKKELTAISVQLGPQQGQLQGPLSAFVNQAADTFDGNGDSFRQALRELSLTAGRLGDSSADIFGTVKNLQTLIDALSNSNEQIVQFSGHLASVSQVIADSSAGLDATLGTLNEALSDVREFLHHNNSVLISQVEKLADLAKVLSDEGESIEQILHVAPHGLANFYNIYQPAQGTLAGLLSLPNFMNPVQFICAGSFDVGANPADYKRSEICRQRMAPVLERLTMNFPPVMFHPINSITAYKGQIIYDTPLTEAKGSTPIPDLQWQPSPSMTPPRMAPGSSVDSLLLPPALSADDGSAPRGAETAPGPPGAGILPAEAGPLPELGVGG